MDNIIGEHLSREFASDIKILLRDLRKILKVLTLYPVDNPLPTKMRGSFSPRFVEVVEESNGLVFGIRPNEIVYNREVVYQDQNKEDTLAAIFYNAGVIHLEFSEGLTSEEFTAFLDSLKEYLNDKSLDRDLVSLLWQEQFSNIKFKTVEDLALSECQTDVMIREMYPDYNDTKDPSSDFDYNQIILEEDDKTNAVSPEAIEDAEQMGLSLDSPPETQDPVNQLLSGSFTPAEEENREIERLLKENRQFDPHRTTTRILFDILHLWDDKKPFIETVTICEKTFDQLLNQGDFAAAADFVHALRGRQKELAPQKPAYADRLNEFILRAGDARRMEQLTEIINRQEVVDAGSIEIYLDSLGWESLAHITGMLGKLMAKKARLMVCDYLAKRGKEHVKIIANGLRDKRWYVARNTIMILGQINGEQVLDYLDSASNHPDHRVRTEAIVALSKNSSDRSIDLICRFLKDSDTDLRAMALDRLGATGGRPAFETMRDIVHSSAFSNYSPDEQEQFLICYSRLGGAEVTGYLASIIGSFSLLNTGWKARYRFMALKALAHNTSDEAEKLILKYTRSRRQWLRQAAVAALEQHRRIIYERGEDQ
jgi:hypothetical protein